MTNLGLSKITVSLFTWPRKIKLLKILKNYSQNMGHRHKNSYCQRKSHEHKHHTIGLTLFSIIIGSRYSVGDNKGLYQSFNVGLGKVKITFGFNDHTLLEC